MPYFGNKKDWQIRDCWIHNFLRFQKGYASVNKSYLIYLDIVCVI